MQVTVKAFENVIAVHLPKKPMTIADLAVSIHKMQKEKASDSKDKFGLLPKQYAFVDLNSEIEVEEKYLDYNTILKGNEFLGLRAIFD